MRRAPAFWWHQRPGLAATLLSPVGSLYGAITARRMTRPGATLSAPVLCVGNLVVGGAGKTPMAIALASLFTALGKYPAFVSRGYGRHIDPAVERSDVMQVDLATHNATSVGDEPLLLAAIAPTFVSADRVAAGRAAIASGADLIILDDGLQNSALAKTFSVAVVDGATGTGNGLCVPAGPLRAPVAAQWSSVSALCVIGPGDAGQRVADAAAKEGIAIWKAQIAADPKVAKDLAGQPLFAFAGIGRPEKFFATLESCGLLLAGQRAFPDHHRFGSTDLSRLERDAARVGARLVTTNKDRVRLPSSFPAFALPISLVFDDQDAVIAILRAALLNDRLETSFSSS